MLSRRICLALMIVAVAATVAHAQRGISVNDGAAASNRRVALVIGNGGYASNPLRNPVNDARAMSRALRGLGFQVISGTDMDYRQMRRAMIKFGRELDKGGVGLFFYAGHGVQVDGQNYLVPIGALISHEEEVAAEAVSLGMVLSRMAGAKNQLNIVILDACRDNPFERNFRSGSKGLAQVIAPRGTIIAYATAPGRTAADGAGSNGVFTEAFLQHMATPGLDIEEVFKRTGRSVDGNTNGRQRPWMAFDYYGQFYFQPGASQATAQPIQLAGGPGATGPTKQERIAKLLEEADALMGAGKLTSPAGNNALEKYNRVLFLQPMNAAAAEGLKNIAAKYVEWARARIKAGDYAKAEMYLQRAEQAREGDPRVLAALDELRRAKAAPQPTTTARPVPQAASSGTPRRFTNSIGMEFVRIPAGSFMMDSPNSEPQRYSDEGPQHRVTISRPFYMQTTEVTQGQWKRVMGNNPSNFSGCGSNCPVENVSWNDAQEFIRKLNAMEGGNKYRLPTEAQWEYACRAGTTTPFNTGDNITTSQANYDGNNPMPGYSKGQYRKQTLPVKSFSPNRWGLYDMHGNVCEWCGDWYGENYYSSAPTRDPQGPSSGTIRVLRGGCWNRGARILRSAVRYRCYPGYSLNFMGCRITRFTP